MADHFDYMIKWTEVHKSREEVGQKGLQDKVYCCFKIMPAWPHPGPSHRMRHLLKAWGAQFQAGHRADCSEFQVTERLLCRIPLGGHASLSCSIPAASACLLKVTGATTVLPGNEGQRSCEEPFVTLRGLVEIKKW